MIHQGIIHIPGPVRGGKQQCVRCKCVLPFEAMPAVPPTPWAVGEPVVYARGGSSVIWPHDDISQTRPCKQRGKADYREVAA